MAKLGTAPRRISPGVWETRKGHKLSRAGNAYWERHYKAGATDGQATSTVRRLRK